MIKRFLCDFGIHFHTRKWHYNEYFKLSVCIPSKMQAYTLKFGADYCGYCHKLLKKDNIDAEFIKHLPIDAKISRSI